MNSMSRQRGVTLVELLVGLAILTVVAGAGLSMARSSATAGRTAAQAVASEGGVVAVVRAMDELRSAVAILDAQPTAVTAVVSSASSGRPLSYRDPATGRTVTLDRYTVRYVFSGGALYRDTGNQPSWAVASTPAGGRPIVPTDTSGPTTPSVGFPGQEPRQPQLVPDPGAPRYITAYQGRSYETVHSGYWLSKSGTSGLATTHAWAQSTWVDGRCYGGREERECEPGYWTTKYYTAGSLYIDAGTYNSIRNTPVRNSDGTIAGYRVGGEIWTSPAGMNNIGSRPYYACAGWFLWWCTGGWYVAGYYVLGGSNELTASEYSSTVGSPMAATRYMDNYATVIDPAWQRQYDAYQQYQRDYHNWQQAHATWQQRYEAWVGYYRSYDRWSEQLALANQANAVLGGILQPIGKTASSPWEPVGGVTLSNQAQVVARLASLSFSYADRAGNTTANPAKVATVTVSYTATSGRSASASASFAGSAASKSSARTWQFPTPCQVDPRTCPPEPPPNDPTRPEWERANSLGGQPPVERTWYGRRTWSDGTVTYAQCTGGRCETSSESAHMSALSQFNAGGTQVGIVQTLSANGGLSGRGTAWARWDSGETWTSSFSWDPPEQ